MPTDSHAFAGAGSGVQFRTTHWSLVLSAADTASDSGQRALEKLCAIYWPAIYSFLRRKGRNPHDAKDLAQDFFTRILRRETFSQADPGRGRFRTFLLECLHSFLVDEQRHAARQKRGGGITPLSLDEAAEESFIEPFSPETGPGELFDRRWRLVLLQQALQRLEREFLEAGKAAQFTLLKEFLTSPAVAGAYDPVAARLSASPRAIAVTIHRMRHRFRELVREELAQTVSSRAELEQELRVLFG